ncbi:MAG: SMP-30/gluconolactonase/LRE family protein [Hyphomonas sp.]|uniref:SMP-30/gluconolactonase/LRE family protein n=1 Tax=Hyphomonas sp. TaxID=87 RepID=UPI0035286EB9
MSFDRRQFLISASATAALAGCATAAAKPAPGPKIEVFDKSIRDLIDADITIEALASGYTWSEGPVWDRKRSCLYFTDVPQNTAWRWSEADGAAVFLRPSGAPAEDTSGFREPGANGLWIAKDGRLLIANHGRRAIQAMDIDTKVRVPLADTFNGHRFNSPNDLIETEKGGIYFTDPPYGLEGMNDSPLKEQNANGVYFLAPDGTVQRTLSDMSFPNGVALSPDESVVYVAQSDPEQPILRACDTDGGNAHVLFDFSPYMSDGPGLPDGLAVSETGHIFQTGPGGVFILTPDGKALGRINTGKGTANCCFGGADGRALYMTAHDTLMRVQTRTRGCQWA